MASDSMPKIPLRIADGVSKPADSQRASFLDLPGEIRNRIYDFVLKEDEPLRITGTPPSSRHSYYPPPVLAASYNMKSSLRLFKTCRAIYHEASSRFFYNNMFVVSKPQYRHDPAGKFIDFIGATWLRSLGSCIHALSKVVIDLDTLCSPTCSVGYYTLDCWDVFYKEDALIEVDSLLHALWLMGVAPRVEVVQPKGEAYQNFQAWVNSPSADFDCDSVKITEVLNTLIEDQLGLRKFGRMLGGVGIKRDGTGGAVHWAKIPVPVQRMYGQWPFNYRPFRNFKTHFISSDDGRQLQWRPVAPSFMGLPEDVREMIYHYAMAPNTPISINLDTQSSFPPSLHHLSRDLYITWQKCYFRDNQFSLSLSTTHSTSTFSGFGPMARLLREPLRWRSFDSEWRSHVDYHYSSILEDCQPGTQKIHVTLNFDIALPIAVDRLRISILPLIMEMSDTPSDDGAYITITHPKAHYAKIIQAEQRIYLRKLRYDVTKALSDFFWSFPDNVDLRRPEVWVNGLGKVVKVTIVDGPFASLAPVDYSLDNKITVKDVRYKKDLCRECHWYSFKSVFPFEDSAEAALDYLRYVVHSKDHCKEEWCSTTEERICCPGNHDDGENSYHESDWAGSERSIEG